MCILFKGGGMQSIDAMIPPALNVSVRYSPSSISNRLITDPMFMGIFGMVFRRYG